MEDGSERSQEDNTEVERGYTELYEVERSTTEREEERGGAERRMKWGVQRAPQDRRT